MILFFQLWDIKKTVHIYHFADKLGGRLFPDYAQCCPVSAAFLVLPKVSLHPLSDSLNSSLHRCQDHLKLDAVTFNWKQHFQPKSLEHSLCLLWYSRNVYLVLLSICIQALGAYSSQFCTSKNNAYVVHAPKL